MPTSLTSRPDRGTPVGEIECRVWDASSSWMPRATPPEEAVRGDGGRDARSVTERRELEIRWACEWWPPD